MTEPNSLFSNMMMAIWTKLGTRGRGVAVCVAVGEGVNVGGTGVQVEVAEGTGDGGAVGEGMAIQADNKMNKKIQTPNRSIKPPSILHNALSAARSVRR